MSNNLPTTPGQHWFRETGTEDWQPYYVTTLDGEGLICHCAKKVTPVARSESAWRGRTSLWPTKRKERDDTERVAACISIN